MNATQCFVMVDTFDLRAPRETTTSATISRATSVQRRIRDEISANCVYRRGAVGVAIRIIARLVNIAYWIQRKDDIALSNARSASTSPRRIVSGSCASTDVSTEPVDKRCQDSSTRAAVQKCFVVSLTLLYRIDHDVRTRCLDAKFVYDASRI